MTPSDAERFWSHVDRTGECWIWRSGRSGSGYGAFHPAGTTRIIQAHRYSYELTKGPIPKEMFVCHTCDNPACVRPDHLWLGTAKENHTDKVNKGHQKTPFRAGHRLGTRTRFKPGQAPGKQRRLTAEQVAEIRRRYVPRKTSYLKLALEYSVAEATIRRAVIGQTYR